MGRIGQKHIGPKNPQVCDLIIYFEFVHRSLKASPQNINVPFICTNILSLIMCVVFKGQCQAVSVNNRVTLYASFSAHCYESGCSAFSTLPKSLPRFLISLLARRQLTETQGRGQRYTKNNFAKMDSTREHGL